MFGKYQIAPYISLLAALISISCAGKEHRTIRVSGSTTIEPFMTRAAKEFSGNRNLSIDVDAVGSKKGIDELIAGNCDIAMSSMEMLPEQTAAAKEKGINIKPFFLGYDIIIPIVHPSNTVSDISFTDLKNVFTNKIKRWTALGGTDTLIDVVDRSDESGTYAVWHHYVATSPVNEDQFTVEGSNSAVLAHVSAHGNAIGYVSAAYLNPDVKALKLDGIAMTEGDSLLSEYHLKRPLFLYVDEDKFDQTEKMFVIFMIINDRGKALLRESGFFYSSWAGQYHPQLP
jgi:phosphate transport system substrate-binding protein